MVCSWCARAAAAEALRGPVISEQGKVEAACELGVDKLTAEGIACLCIDVRGFGELTGLDARLMTYLGTGMPFAMAIDAVCAARAAKSMAKDVVIVGRGASGAQVALFAGLLEPWIPRGVWQFRGEKAIDLVDAVRR